MNHNGMTYEAARDEICHEEPTRCSACCGTPASPTHPACESASAPVDGHADATCGSRAHWLMRHNGMTKADALKEICKEEPENCKGCCGSAALDYLEFV